MSFIGLGGTNRKVYKESISLCFVFSQNISMSLKSAFKIFVLKNPMLKDKKLVTDLLVSISARGF